jgi:membrane protease YdiL (CAAX protease family)
MSEVVTSPGVAAPERSSVRTGRVARWRGRLAMPAVAAGFIVGQLVALGIVEAAGGSDASLAVAAVAFVVADLIALAVVLWAASRGTDRLGAATFGIRHTRAFWPAVGWTAAVYFGVASVEGLWALIVGAPEPSGVAADTPTVGTALLVLLAIAVAAPVVEEIAFRGYLFPALTHWRGPWVGAALTGVVFAGAHAGVYPVRFLPALIAFGFGACVLFWLTGSLLPCIALHAFNNAIVVAVGFGWTWEVAVAVIAAVCATQLLLAPFARERAPRTA